jgi:hypothetical protein
MAFTILAKSSVPASSRVDIRIRRLDSQLKESHKRIKLAVRASGAREDKRERLVACVTGSAPWRPALRRSHSRTHGNLRHHGLREHVDSSRPEATEITLLTQRGFDRGQGIMEAGSQMRWYRAPAWVGRARIRQPGSRPSTLMLSCLRLYSAFPPPPQSLVWSAKRSKDVCLDLRNILLRWTLGLVASKRRCSQPPSPTRPPQPAVSAPLRS